MTDPLEHVRVAEFDEDDAPPRGRSLVDAARRAGATWVALRVGKDAGGLKATARAAQETGTGLLLRVGSTEVLAELQKHRIRFVRIAPTVDLDNFSCVFMNDVAAIPTAPNANPTRSAAGTARTTHGDTTRPSTTSTTMNPIEYRPPRMSAQTSSPTAMSPADSGVERIAVKVLL